jgi:hydroxymethylpyrimidine pyrophosphatase-like HAD family hydrolase
MNGADRGQPAIKLMVSDVDGTLITPDKVLTGVQRAARRITTSYQEEGFAEAVDRFVLRMTPV